MKYWLYLLLLMATPALAQVRLSPCDKQDYELYASRLKALFNPDASQQYIVVDGQKELYALQVIKGSHLGQRKRRWLSKISSRCTPLMMTVFVK